MAKLSDAVVPQRPDVDLQSRPSQPSRPSSHSIPSAPYGPRNTLHSAQDPSFAKMEAPKFGSTTPMKSSLPGPLPYRRPDDMRARDERDSRHPPIPKTHRAEEYTKLLPAKDKELWRPKNSNTVDLTGNDEPQVIPRPQNFPSFSSANREAFSAHSQNRTNGFTSVKPGGYGQNFVDLTKKPPVYSLPGGGAVPGAQATYYGGEYVDTNKTVESIKELLEGMNDSPAPKKTRKKKKKGGKATLKDDAELAELMKAANLRDAAKASSVNVNEQPEGDAKQVEENDGEDDEEEEEEDLSVVEGLNVTLLPHQIRGLAFLLKREEGKNRGGILADDMGLGKTIQSISLILSHPHPRYPIASGSAFSSLSPDSKQAALKLPSDVERGTLVIAPLALIRQWENEIKARTEDSHKLRVLVHHGPSRTKNSKDLRKYDIVITTYDVVRSEHSQSSYTEDGDGRGDAVGCFGIRWWRIICDEAHTIKNRLAKASLAACALKARYRWCLTGTPMQNNLDELQSLIKFLRVKPYDDLAAWKEQILRPMKENRGGIAIERLQLVLRAIMLRRTKEVLKQDAAKSGAVQDARIQLPERNMEKIAASFDEREKVFYEKLEARTEESLEKMMSGFGKFGTKMAGGNMTSALVLLLRLRQACNHPHLLAGKIHKDADSGLGLATPRKKTVRPSQNDAGDEDDLADLLGGLSVDQKKCEVCCRALTQEETRAGDVRCTECTEDLRAVEKAETKAKKHKKHRGTKKEKIPKKKKRQRPVVLDSDDEDDGSQAEEGSDTEEEEDTSFSHSVDNSGFIDSEAEESDTPESGQENDSGDDEEGEDLDDSDYEDDYSQLVASTKITYLINILKKELPKKHKTIVFSQFTSMLDLIEPFLHREGIAFARYDGSMKNDAREASLRRLRGEGEFGPRKGREDRDFCGVLLCSLKCGALGLNLTAACRVVILEPFWNPFIEEQAIDRVHRIGQKKDVTVYKLTIENTVEERILQLQEKKRELAKAAIGDGEVTGKERAAKLNMKDILYLFRRDAEGSRPAAPNLNAKTRILKERPTSSSLESPRESREGRYTSPEAERQKEWRREKEKQSAYSRRW